MKVSTGKFLVLPIILCYANLAYCFQKTLEYTDHSYESTIKTVQLYPDGLNVESVLAPAASKIDQSRNLILEFDDLKEDADYYYVRFIHCNADWTPSDFRSNMVVQGYNEFEIEDFEFSSEAKVNYIHYRFKFPQFKKSGNFLAVVYRNQDKNDIVLTRRFMIYDERAITGARVVRSSSVGNRLSHQRIEVTVNYANLKSTDPKENFKVVVRQNQRWDNAKYGLPITFLNENSKVITYRNLGEGNDFAGGNEFRFFDLSTVNFTGRNVAEVQFINNRPVARIKLDKTLSESYFQNLDVNGKYYIRDREANSSGITAEYVETTLSLNIPEQRSSIYAIGSFNDWRREESNRMVFNKATNLYQATLLLKQGWYDYTYWVDDPLDPHQIDRSFFDAENQYEVFVYFRGIGSRGDELVGYTRLNYNQRR